jgi:hypothetical protein
MADGLSGALEAWREAERDLAQQRPGTPEYAAASKRAEACREAYRAMAIEVQLRSTASETLADDRG